MQTLVLLHQGQGSVIVARLAVLGGFRCRCHRRLRGGVGRRGAVGNGGAQRKQVSLEFHNSVTSSGLEALERGEKLDRSSNFSTSEETRKQMHAAVLDYIRKSLSVRFPFKSRQYEAPIQPMFFGGCI